MKYYVRCLGWFASMAFGSELWGKPPLDYGRVVGQYLTYRQQLPKTFFDRVGVLIGARKRLHLKKRRVHILDVGTGTGMVALGVGKRFSSQVHVTGIDTSKRMIESAGLLGQVTGYPVTFKQTAAEDTSLATGSFDMVLAARAWHWFDEARALEEVKRLLQPNGYFLIANYGVAKHPLNELTRSLIKQYNPAWEAPSELQRPIGYGQVPLLRAHGFSDVRYRVDHFPFRVSQHFWVNYVDTWSSLAANPDIDQEKVEHFNAAHEAKLAEVFGEGASIEMDFEYTLVEARMGTQVHPPLHEPESDPSYMDLVARL